VTPHRKAYMKKYRETYIEPQSTKDAKRAYRRSFKGKVVHTYLRMVDRVKGATNRSTYYKGLEILTREEFYKWALNNTEYIRLHAEWNGICRKTAPSIDRIDSNKGYVLGNMQWITVSQNSKKARVA